MKIIIISHNHLDTCENYMVNQKYRE